MQTNAWRIGVDDFNSFLAVLDRVKALGFEGFETGFRNVQPAFGARAKEAKAKIAASGLRFLGCHIFLNNYDAKTNTAPMELVQQIADGAAALGAERLILSGAPLVDEDGKMDDQRLRWKAGQLNRAARYCYDLKLKLAYHNHGPEFTHNGTEIYALARETDADLVHFIIDAGHALRVKADVAAFFNKFHKRIDGMHLRDFNAQKVQVPLGQGTMPYEPLIEAVRKQKWTGWLIGEEERESGEKPGEAAAGPARDQIRKWFGV